jgi:hypothetical protein
MARRRPLPAGHQRARRGGGRDGGRVVDQRVRWEVGASLKRQAGGERRRMKVRERS